MSFDISSYYCPNTSAFEIFGQGVTRETKSIMFMIKRCDQVAADPANECANSTEFDLTFPTLYAEIAIQTKVFNMLNFNSTSPLSGRIVSFK